MTKTNPGGVMSKIVILYLKENIEIVRRLVSLLEKFAPTWWCEDKYHEDWESDVREEINNADLIIPVLSSKYVKERRDILYGEISYAKQMKKRLLPFCIEKVELPFSLSLVDCVNAFGWQGEDDHPEYKKLIQKVKNALSLPANHLARSKELRFKDIILHLPAFVFSISSHETQLVPLDGITLLGALRPKALLVSAYDAKKAMGLEKEKNKVYNEFQNGYRELQGKATVVFLDSGNYEAERKKDHYDKDKNLQGWCQKQYWKIVKCLGGDIIFSYDKFIINDDENEDDIANMICEQLEMDYRKTGVERGVICPIVHLPQSIQQADSYRHKAADIVARVALHTKPTLVAIPERELGDGILERMRCVSEIRKRLNSLGTYYPLHILGTGNPISIALLTVAGADSFDGLEWCRTVANQTGRLFHFQYLQPLKKIQYSSTLLNVLSKEENYTLRVAIHNFDCFDSWMSSIQELIRAENEKEIFHKVNSSLGVEFDWNTFRDEL